MANYAIETGSVLDVLRAQPDNSFDACLCDPPYGFRFMGKKWDYDVPTVAEWSEVLRVLKPGAPLLSFGGARTYHRLACGIEDAGFELRDCLMWLYGKGFPKSLNVVKAGAAADWDGYGTALKPAHEPIALARKPLDGTVANNVTTWGTGALAIDACRIDWKGKASGWSKTGSKASANVSMTGDNYAREAKPDDDGRWPANLLLDEEAASLLDASTAPTKSTPYPENEASGAVLPLKARAAGGYSDAGGPSRFFYCAKVSTKERDRGCEALTPKSAGEMTEREDGQAGLDNPRAGAGRTGGARNHHPTLKPLALIQYLARLILPPTESPVLLVPWSGSGSEMIGAMLAGWPAVFGVEREAEYVEIARHRIPAWVKDACNVAA